MRAIRIATADDSDLARALLRDVIGHRPELALVAEARSVEELERAVATLNPQVVTLDLLMPGRAGLSAIKRLSERAAVVVVSDAKQGSPLANESLAQGATAFVPKRTLGTAQGRAEFLRVLLSAQKEPVDYVVAIAGSTGAMPALERFAGELGQLRVAVTVVQHLPSERMSAFAGWLSHLGLPAQVAEQPLALSRGAAVVAPGHHHLVVARGERAELDASPPVAGHRPSADVLFRSLVPVARQTMAVVLSGMGRDGAAGIAPLVAAGAACIVQRPDTCSVDAMPMAAQEAARGLAWPLAPQDIGAAIRGWLGGKRLG